MFRVKGYGLGFGLVFRISVSTMVIISVMTEL